MLVVPPPPQALRRVTLNAIDNSNENLVILSPAGCGSARAGISALGDVVSDYIYGG